MLADGQTEARREVFPVPLLLRPNPPYSGLLLPWPEPALSPLLIRGKCFQSRKGDEIFTEIFTDKWLLAEGLGTDRTGSTERRGWHRWQTLPSRPSPREGGGPSWPELRVLGGQLSHSGRGLAWSPEAPSTCLSWGPSLLCT